MQRSYSRLLYSPVGSVAPQRHQTFSVQHCGHEHRTIEAAASCPMAHPEEYAWTPVDTRTPEWKVLVSGGPIVLNNYNQSLLRVTAG